MFQPFLFLARDVVPLCRLNERNNMNKHFTLSAALFLASVLCGAQEYSSPMTLKDCMEYAVSNSTKMRIREAENSDARLQRRDAVLSMFLPSISGGVAAYYNFGRSIDPETNTYRTSTSFHNSYQVSGSITLFDGFSAVNNMKISKNALLMGRSQDRQTEADICLTVMESFYNVLYYKQLSDIYASQAENAEAAYHKALKQEELGQISHADVVQLSSELADKQYDLVNTRNMYDNELTTLEDLMFWPSDSSLEIDTEVPQVQMADPQNVDEIVGFAKDNDPTVLSNKYEMANAKFSLSSARGRLAPNVGLYGGWSTTYYTYPGSGQTMPIFKNQFRNNGGEYVQLSVSIPIFDRLSRQSAIGRKKNAYKQAAAKYDQSVRDVETAVRKAVMDRDGAWAAYYQAQRRTDIQDEAYMLSSKQLEQGLISTIEFRTASDKYLASKADRLNSMFKYLIKNAVVKYYNGVDYINQ